MNAPLSRRGRTPWLVALILLTLGAPLHPAHGYDAFPLISRSEAERIGERIWWNEARGRTEYLIWWNPGEPFPSLGIGHFIWYPPGQEGPFEESFPALLAFMLEQGVSLPVWLTPDTDAPWRSREVFLQSADSPEVVELRRMLTATVAEQSLFMMHRLRRVEPELLAAAPADARRHVKAQFERLAATPQGLYALVDYLNFKGSGLTPTERYAGQGWGLLQVLEAMDPHAQPGPAFAASAADVLRERVRNSPPERDESRWLPGWLRRVQSYADPVQPSG